MSFDGSSSEKPHSQLPARIIPGTSDRKDLFQSFNPVYQPNFVLVNYAFTPTNRMVFGDIIPVYRSYQELTNIVVTSWESLNHLVLFSSTFTSCLLSIVNTFLQSTVYQSYVAVTSLYIHTKSLPERYTRIEKKLEQILQVFADAQTRDLWWLEVKLDVKTIIQQLNQIANNIWAIAQKFYLAIVVLMTLGVLNSVSIGSSQPEQPNSFLSQFIQNYSLEQQQPLVAEASQYTPTQSAFSIQETVDPVQKIIEYQVGEGETVEEIAQMYGVKPETIIFNNNLTEDLKADQKIYIPWVNGYIYNPNRDISPEELEKIYGINKDSILTENSGTFDPAIGKFHQETLVLIPTEDFEKIKEANIAEEQRQKNARFIAANQAKRRLALAQASIASSKTTLNSTSTSEAKSKGFVWPTTGNISRCFSAGHHGCDIANFSAPAIRSVQSGTVKMVSRYQVAGYGLMVIIDHGNGVNTLYAHMSEIYVSEGQTVSQGQSIGKMGRTGLATGIHLHFEVRVNGVQVNPLPYLP